MIKNITKKINDELFFSLNEILLVDLKRNTPTKNGDTERSWKLKKSDKLGEFILTNSRGNIVKYLEEGTSAHIIRPNTKKMLKFELTDDNDKPKRPTFRNPIYEKMFRKNKVVFIYNRQKVPILGYVQEGSKYYMFAKKVKHPGTEATHFVRDTINNPEMWKRVQKDVEAHI